MKRICRLKINIAVFLVSVSLGCGALCIPAKAAPTYDDLPEGMTAERLTQLNDAVIEWDEIEDLVVYWNPTYTRYFNAAQSNVTELRAGYSDFVDEVRDQLEEIDGAIEQIRTSQEMISSLPGSMVPYGGAVIPKDAALQALQDALNQTKEGRRQLKGALHSTKTGLNRSDKSIDIRLRPLREQMISVVRGLVVSYKQLETNRTMVAKQVELYQTIYTTQQHMFAQNMATALDVQAYEDRLNSAVQSLAQIDAGLAQLRKNIALQCGYRPDTEVVIADIPAPDVHFLEGRDYAADRQRAVSGNPEVIEAGRVKNFSSYGFQLRDLSENEATGKASAKMDTLYAEIQKQTALCEAAEISRQKAERTRDSAERQNALGLLGRSEYEGLQMQYISYEAAARLASLNLTQAIDTYLWALRGIMTLE